MDSRRGEHARAARVRANRKVLLACLVISVGLHGWAFAGLTFAPADLSRTAGVPERVTMQSEYDLSAIEVVQLVPEREEVEPIPLPTEERPVVAAAAPEHHAESAAETAEPGSQVAAADDGSQGVPGSTPDESSGEAAVAEQSAPALTFAELLESANGRPAVALPRFAAQRPLEGQAPIEAVVVDPHAGHDHAEEEKGSIWGTVWRRMGKTFGFGGDKLCIPIPAAKAGAATEPSRR